MKAILPIIIEHSSTPMYIQIYQEIKKSILSNEVASHDRLPSLRSLASSLKISVTTVDLAYSQLLVEGFIYSKANSGYFISEISHYNNDNKSTKSSFPFLNSETTLSHYTSPYFYDVSCFDFPKWKKSITHILNDYPHLLLTESEPQGELFLRQEIAKYLYISRGFYTDSENIFISAGTQQTTLFLTKVLQILDIKNIAVEEYGYEPVNNVFHDNDLYIHKVPLISNGIHIESLPQNISSAVYVNPSNQFYTGSVMPINRRYELIKWAKENNSFIIEDDYDSELRYFGRPIPSLKSLDIDNRVIYLGSFSSTLFPAAKISYMVLPQNLSSILQNITKKYTQTCSKLEQLALGVFMSKGHYMSGIRKMRRLYSQKLQTTINAFNRNNIHCQNTNSGINLNFTIKTDKSSDEILEIAKALNINIAISPIESKSNYTKNLIIYYNQIPKDLIDSVIDNFVLKIKK